MARAPQPIRHGFAELQEQYGIQTISEGLQLIAKMRLKEQIALGNSNFVMRVDGRDNKPFKEVKRRINFYFAREIAMEMLRLMAKRARRVSYIEVVERSGRLGRDWSFYLERFGQADRKINNINELSDFRQGDKVYFVQEAPYAWKMHHETREAVGDGIVRFLAGAMNNSRYKKDFYFIDVGYPKGAPKAERKPAVKFGLRGRHRVNVLGAAL